MKPNSCLYRAVKRVVSHQFGIDDLASDVFYSYNNGDGVPTPIIADVTDEALKPYGVKTAAVYANLSDPENFTRCDLLKPPQFVKAPCIAHVKDHVEAVLPGEHFNCDMAIVLESINDYNSRAVS